MRWLQLVIIVWTYITLLAFATDSPNEAGGEQPSEGSVTSSNVWMNSESIRVTGAYLATQVSSCLQTSPSLSPRANLLGPTTSTSSHWLRILQLIRRKITFRRLGQKSNSSPSSEGSSADGNTAKVPYSAVSKNVATTPIPIPAHSAGSPALFESSQTFTTSYYAGSSLSSRLRLYSSSSSLWDNVRAGEVSQGKSRIHELNNTFHSVQTALSLGSFSPASASSHPTRSGQLSSAAPTVPPIQAGASAVHSWVNSTARSSPSATGAAPSAARNSSGQIQTYSTRSGSTRINTHSSLHLPRIPRTVPWVSNETYGYGSGTLDARTPARFGTLTGYPFNLTMNSQTGYATPTLKRRNTFSLAVQSQPTPFGCRNTVPNSFELSVIDATTGDVVCPFHLQASRFILSNGILRSRQTDVGYIASNGQFRFADPFQPNIALDTKFSICSNASLAFGESTVFYRCFNDESFGIFNEPSGILCSPVIIGVVDTPILSTSVGLATFTKVATPVSSQMVFPTFDHSETFDDADAADPVEFDLGVSEHALLVERSRKTRTRHHLTIVRENPNRSCKTGYNNKLHRCKFHINYYHGCNERKCKHGHGVANTLVTPSTLTDEEAMPTHEPLMSSNRRRQGISTLFPAPNSSFSG